MYKLMNKDNCIGEFDVIVDENGNERIASVTDIRSGYADYYNNDIELLIKSRMAPLNREHIDTLYRKTGCTSIKQYLEKTHALSLIDSLWVKSENDSLNRCDVSLFTNEFNKTVSDIALDGKEHSGSTEGLSPELTTDGTYAKCWSRENGSIFLLKAGTAGFANAGSEPYSEYFSSQVLDALGVNHVKYNLRERNGIVVSECCIFTSENTGYLPMSLYNRNAKDIKSVIDTYDKAGFKDKAIDMLIADSVILNEDRHLGNFGFTVDTSTGRVTGMAPMFDHNVSLLCYAMPCDFEDIDNYIYSNNKGHKLGGDTFESVAKELLNDTWRRRLNNLYGFKLRKHEKFNLPDWRIEELNKLINRQIEKILKG